VFAFGGFSVIYGILLLLQRTQRLGKKHQAIYFVSLCGYFLVNFVVKSTFKMANLGFQKSILGVYQLLFGTKS
jgi:hypothetical protein